MFRILITGASGQLGSEFAALEAVYHARYQFIYLAHKDMDICVDAATWAEYLVHHQIQAVINTAAYTKVDKAESDAAVALAVNHYAVENLSRACAMADCALIHYSTDFVFGGDGNKPYSESAITQPKGIYAHSKLLGEEAALLYNKRVIVLRTAWVYSSFGNNFVKTMRRLCMERSPVRVVYDQVGSPTYAADLAQVTLDILAPLLSDAKHEAWGQIFHYANAGVASWFDLAYAVIQATNPHCKVVPIKSKDYPTPAKRPAYSVLDTDKIRQLFGVEIPYWRDSLMRCLEKIVQDNVHLPTD